MNFSYSLTENARRYPDKTAIIDGDRSFTYRQFNTRVDAIARALSKEGFGPKSTISVLMWNRTEFLEAYYAIMRIGAICVPLSFRLANDEIHYELDHSDSVALFTEERFHESMQVLTKSLPKLKVLITADEPRPEGWRSQAAMRDTAGDPVSDAPRSLDDVQRIMYTSGTTSRPKAAMTTHGQVYWGGLGRLSDFRLNEDDVTFAVGPLFHVGALDTFCTPMLMCGGTVLIIDKFSPKHVLEQISKHRGTCGWLAPTMINLIFQDPDFRNYDMSSVTRLLVGGEKSPLPLLQQVKREWPNANLYDVYGLTEGQGLSTFLPPELAVSHCGSVGRAARMREVRVVDDNDVDVPVGEPGEVIVRSPVVFPGYFKDEEATRAALRNGWLHTGDMAVKDADGYLTIVDRKKDMIRSGGENIAASEVERVIYELKEIGEAAVVAMADPKWIEVPAAFVVLKAGQKVDEKTILDHCATRLAKFKVPKLVRYIDALPRTPSGKIMKKDLRVLLQKKDES